MSKSYIFHYTTTTIHYIVLVLLDYYTIILKTIKIKIILLLIWWSCKATENREGSCITRQDRNKMHSDRYASHEFRRALHVKECLSESLCLRYSLCLCLIHYITVLCVRASALPNWHALPELGTGFLPAVGVSVCVSVSLLKPCCVLGLGSSGKR